jgi:GTP-binding protein
MLGAAIMATNDELREKTEKPSWRVVEANFEKSATTLAQCPTGDLPEIALAGRSNVGKSSVLNALTGQRGLARVSKSPGCTRLLNFFIVRMAHPIHGTYTFRIADLPGYGFAKAARAVRETFEPMISQYLTHRSALRALLVLMDSRRGPGDLDVQMLEYAGERSVPGMIIATKSDKLSSSERGLLTRRFADELGVASRDIWLTSAHAGIGFRGVGRGDVVAELGDQLVQWSADVAAAAIEPNPELG